MSDLVLVNLDRATLALAQCKDAMESKQVADIAEAARVYLERTNASVETVNRATEVRILAERQMGAFLKDMPSAQGRRSDLVPSKNQVAPTLSEIGITKKQSHVAQKLADIPETEFRGRIEAVKSNGEKLSLSKITNHVDPVHGAKHVSDDGQSNNLYSLNFYWKRASKADRAQFVKQNKQSIAPLL